ncbi:glycerol-3-phosphate cytidylyltransferase [Anaeromyxobacter sp. SG64]|uniref:glycerol-3-phosphate cytidylyltransferase n=1 Tax=unclassified Anaeromyxobacter TaxID=2620896 RepID=UPI0035A87F35
MKTVITYGTFDLFHVGHLKLLERLRAMGDRLIVGVSTDEFNALKGKRAFMPYEHRAEIVSSIRYVDLVIPERDWDQKARDVREHSVDVFGIGDDWAGKFDFMRQHCDVVYLPRTHGVSSTSLKSLARAFDKDTLARLAEAQVIINDLLKDFRGD